MSETGGDRPDLTKLTWAEGPGAYTVTEPLPAKKQVGWDNGPPGEIPAAEHHNWLFQFWAQFSRWLDAAHIREFADLNEAVGATTVPELFRIGQPSGGNRAFLDYSYQVTPTSFTSIADGESDGENNYYLDNGGYVAGLNCDDGTELFSVSPSNIVANCIAAEGRAVYVPGNVTSPGLVKLNRLTGSEIGRSGVQYGHADLASNGTWCAAAGPTANRNNCYLYNIGGGTPVEVSAGIAHGDTVDAVAVDYQNVYFAGGANTSTYDVEAYSLGTSPSLVWQIKFPVSSATLPPVNGLACDGIFVYAATDRVALTAGGYANLFVMQVSDGKVVANLDVQRSGTTYNAGSVKTDGDIVFVNIGVGGCIPLRFVPGPLGVNDWHEIVYLGGIGRVLDCDGIAFMTYPAGTPGQAERYFYQLQPTTYQRSSLGDPVRRPFYKIALPVR